MHRFTLLILSFLVSAVLIARNAIVINEPIFMDFEHGIAGVSTNGPGYSIANGSEGYKSSTSLSVINSTLKSNYGNGVNMVSGIDKPEDSALSFRAYIKKIEGNIDLKWRINCKDANGSFVRAIVSPVISPGEEWEEINFRFDPSLYEESIKTLDIRFGIKNTGAFLVDDYKIWRENDGEGGVNDQVIYVSPDGNDNNTGTIDDPFKTINKAVEMLNAGGTCIIKQGTYHEKIELNTSGTPNFPTTFKAYQNDEVIISGGDPITRTWERWSENPSIWRVQADRSFTQLFLDGVSMIEARWPNMQFHENWNEDKKWTMTGTGSEFGKVKSNGVAGTAVDLTGGLVYIKVGKGNNCYSREILEHNAGATTFKWDTTQFVGIQYTGEDGDPVKMEKYGYANNEFFVTGKLGLLDAPTEWFYDEETSWLYYYPPAGVDPNQHLIENKSRQTGIAANDRGYFKFEGLTFRGCNVEMMNCHNIEIDSCRFVYPTYRFHYFNSLDKQKEFYHSPIVIDGTGNVVTNCEVAWADMDGIHILGENSRIENCVIHDCNLHGKHAGPGITAKGPNTYVKNCTVYDCGGVGIYSINKGPVYVENVHVFNCGIHCVDVSGYYIPWGKLQTGSVASYGWYHNIKGIGMRCDSYGQDVSAHHNVVWECESRNCKWEGYAFNIYNNTFVAPNDSESGLMFVLSDGASLDDINTANNVTLYRVYLRGNGFTNIPDNGTNFSNNRVIRENELAAHFIKSSEPFDWRLKSGSSLVDAGKQIPGITDGYKGNAPDIGAYESGGDYWAPGADWLPGGLIVPKTISDADVLAKELQENWKKEHTTGLLPLRKDWSSYQLQIWPNPVGEQLEFNFRGKLIKPIQLTIYDMCGQMKMKMYDISFDDNRIEIGRLKCGVYLISISTGNEIYQGKFVKRS